VFAREHADYGLTALHWSLAWPAVRAATIAAPVPELNTTHYD
jgi:hypothetical protein